MRVTNADVIIAGAGPTGLMLAAELLAAGVRPVVLERQPQLRTVPKANGFSGQILQLLSYRGVLDRFESAGAAVAAPTAAFPFGGLHVDLSPLPDPPLRALHLAQPRLEQLLDELVRERGGEVRRGHTVTGIDQDGAGVTVAVSGPDGPYQLTAHYVVGCDGARSKVRELAGIPFPGITYPEVNRLGQVAVAAGVTVLDNGDLDVAGHGVVPAGFTRTDRGVFAVGSLANGLLMVQTTEDTVAETDDNEPMTLEELGDSIRRVLGVDLPLGEPIRLSRYQFQARQAESFRAGRILVAGDAAHTFPATGVGLNAGMLDAVNLAWKLAADIEGRASDGLLDSYHAERSFAAARTMVHTQAQAALRRGDDPAAEALRTLFQELLTDAPALRRLGAMIAGADIRYPMPNPNGHPLTGAFLSDLRLHTGVAQSLHDARPVLLDLADRADLREIAEQWGDRVDIRTATTVDRSADAVLIRPDAHIAWAATVGESSTTAEPGLRDALTTWFGVPTRATVSSAGNTVSD
ncbi:FAD-dependent monooxygenase [Nocardia sp. NPDC101769]|uniref:FAD-dependent monooxygenase n=1 Tax=Nocardia sp. NPDC101769 TaxID=3364333 RepID=UPI00380899CB